MLVIAYWLLIVNWPATACAAIVTRGFQSGFIYTSVIMHCYAGQYNTEANAFSVTGSKVQAFHFESSATGMHHFSISVWNCCMKSLCWRHCCLEGLWIYIILSSYLYSAKQHTLNISSLIHWGVVAHICVHIYIYASLNFIIISAGCDLTPIQRQVIFTPTLIYSRWDL